MSFHKKRKGNVNCCVVGCNNKYGNTSETIKFYHFPPDNDITGSRRKKWINNVKRINEDGSPWVPTKNTRICSIHFVGNKKSEHPHHPATIFQTHKSGDKTLNSSRFERLKSREQNSLNRRLKLAEVTEINTSFEESQVSRNIEVICQTEDNYIQNNTGEIISETFFCCSYIKENGVKMDSCTQTNIELKRRSCTMKNAKCGPIHCYNSSQSNSCLDCKSFHGFDSLKDEKDFIDLTGVKEPVFLKLLNLLEERNEVKISKSNKLLIFLMKLKTDLTFSALGVLFSLHRTTISKIFFSVLQNLARATQNYIYWPTKNAVVNTSPHCFKIHYPQCRVIIDCTEIKVQQPAKISERIFLYSHYKGTYTAKVLIGITPSGVISFISSVYGGKASDVQITNECGLLDKLENNDIVLADKGFPGIKIDKNVLFVLPPFLHDNKLTQEEVATCYNIASVRIHVERVIGRIKNFHILQNRISVNFFPYLDDIIHVICVLVNLRGPLINDDK